MTARDDTDSYHPYESEDEAVEQACHDAYQGVMEDPPEARRDPEYVEYCIEYAAESLGVEHRIDEIRQDVYERTTFLDETEVTCSD